MSEKQEQPKTFWLQQGSFRTIVVDNDKANPDWGRKPFKVIEIFAFAKLKVENVELKWSYKMLEDKREDLLLSLRERNSEILQLKEKLWAAEGRLKGMTEGLEILKRGES